MKPYPKILWAITILLIAVGCAHETLTVPDGDVGQEKSVAETLINGYVVQYDGRVFEFAETTFHYTVYGTGDHPALNQLRLELPECAGELSGHTPTDSVRFLHDDETGIDYIKWLVTIQGDDQVGRQFSITYPGDVPEGAIHSAVRAGHTLEFGQVPGPCAGFEIAGAVYIDADDDGERDFDELGIGNVAIELEQPDGSVIPLLTDDLGEYSVVRTEGDYILRIVYDGYPEAFNAVLQESFDATTPLEIQVTVGPDTTDNDFGFTPRTDAIIEQLEDGDLVSNGQNVKFWTKQIEWALEGVEDPDVVHDREELEAFLAAIQELYLTEFFQFTPGSELDEALAILRVDACRTTDSCEPIEILRQQLLTTELNEVSGRGLVDDPELQGVLIAWGEAVLVENPGAARDSSGSEGDEVGLKRVEDRYVLPAIDVFTLINTGGGGGVDE